jgi:serine/threonine protein kinase
VLSRLRTELAGEFSVTRELGRGGQAQVYLAEDRALNRRVAIKVLTAVTGADVNAIQRFRKEARTIAAFQHPHIVKIFGIRQVAELNLLVMQYLGGRPLSEMLATEGALPLPATLTILHQVGRALDYAHNRGVVHRDIKPSNVLFDGDGNAVVTDFGIARLVKDEAITRASTVLGTPTYMSPEQCHGDAVTAASDQYSLGITIYEMLIGEPPYKGRDFSVMQAHVEGALVPSATPYGGCLPRNRRIAFPLSVTPWMRWGQTNRSIRKPGVKNSAAGCSPRSGVPDVS